MAVLKKRAVPFMGLLLLVLVIGVVVDTLNVRAQDDSEFTYAGKSDAPEFPTDVAWLNVERPLTLADLRGKVVLLDFWTYGCIDCMHIIPDLKRLEAEFPTQLVVVGVHSAKFENEGLTENIRQVVQRYGVQHPVINDAGFEVWQTYGVQAWPTAGLIDPTGKVVGGRSGEGVYDFFEPIIKTMVEEYTAAGLINTDPLPLKPETSALSDTPLSFPGKVLVDEAGKRLFIADSGHNRIVVASLDNYEVQQVIGTGAASLVDGDFATATFHTPQGMSLAGDILYVADTNNHAIRAIDLAAGTVTRVAGTGAMSQNLMTEGTALLLDLRSPWDVLVQGDILYIAMAGSHQLWELNLTDGKMQPFAGDGREELVDGARLDAELAQPSGLATDGENLYFADSESSSIRQVGLAEDGKVKTLIGPVNESQGRLFAFGDVDGDDVSARLQHPLGVTVAEDGLLYVADTYNNKIKVIDPAAQTSTTFAGDVKGGYFDGTGAEALFDEPGGITYSDGKLYVADTNNQAIRVIDIATQSVSTVIFPNVNVLLSSTTAAIAPLAPDTSSISSLFDSDKTIVLDPQTVAPGMGKILVNAEMPFGYKLNAQAPFTAVWAKDGVVTLSDDALNYQQVVPDLPIEFPVTLTEGQTELSVDLTIYWCETIKETLCFVERGKVVLPVTVSADTTNSDLYLDYTLVPPTISDELGGN